MESKAEEPLEKKDKIEAVGNNEQKVDEVKEIRPDASKETKEDTEQVEEGKQAKKTQVKESSGKEEGATGGSDPDQDKAERQVTGQESPADEKTESESEKIDMSNEPALDDDGRMTMFEEGLKLDKEGKKTEALKSYLKCLVGLKQNSRFSLLPQCLRNIGDIYYNKDEYDKAISFIQAEKLYYESVLIDDTELQKHIDEVMAKTGDEAAAETETDINAMRAAEYEQLAKLCMDEKQPQLALEYAGKATKLRQQVYGDDHPLVQQSLDYFATVYAEVGKAQYSESMSKYEAAGEPDMTGGANLSASAEPTSILRKRKGEPGEKEKKVRFDESQIPTEEVMQREEKFARVVLLLLFFSLCFIILLLGIYIYCNIHKSTQCANYRQFLHDCTMRVRYWYYHYSSTKDNKYT